MQYKGQATTRDGFRLALDNYMHRYRSDESVIKQVSEVLCLN